MTLAVLLAGSTRAFATGLTGRRTTGLQRQVLSLYRRASRAARAKDRQHQLLLQQGQRDGVGCVGFGSWQAYARSQFERHRHLKFKDHMMIEYHIRRGAKSIDMLSRPEVHSLHPG